MRHAHALLVESHPLLRQTLRQMLADAGLTRVEEAEDAVAAVRLSVRQRPELVVVDMTMAEVSGLVVGGLLHELLPGCQVILLVDDAATYRSSAAQAGVAACISKGAVRYELPLLLSRLLAETA